MPASNRSGRFTQGRVQVFDRFLIARPIEDVLRLVVVAFRIGSWLWMSILAVATLSTDELANRTVVTAALVLATVWTAVTVFAGLRDAIDARFYVADGIAVLLIALAPSVAGAQDFFYGGMPLSWLFAAAFVGGTMLTLVSAFVLSAVIESGIAVWPQDASLTSALGLVLVFVIPAIVIAWAFDTLRFTDARRRLAEEALLGERTERIRQEERADVAIRLHDSVLQTLSIIESRSTEAETRRLARRERHAMRRLIDSLAFGASHSLKGKLLEIADDIEDSFMVTVDAAFVGNAALDDDLERLCAATREAMTNAAKHSGCDRLSLFAEVDSGSATTTVKDEGRGIDDDRVSRDLERSLTNRITPSEGTASVRSTPGELTIVELTVSSRGSHA